jgi:MarR family transcriptional repressor of emrRAB
MCIMHSSRRIADRRSANLAGALAIALADRLGEQLASDSAALLTLYERGPLTVEFLRRVIGLSHSATVRLVDRLSNQRLAKRTAGPDARSIFIRLTPRGRRRAEALRERREEALTRALAALDARERAEFARLAEKLLVRLTGGRWHARLICRLCDHGVCQAGAACPVDLAAAAVEPAP